MYPRWAIFSLRTGGMGIGRLCGPTRTRVPHEDGFSDTAARPEAACAQSRGDHRHAGRLRHPVAVRMVQHRGELGSVCEHVGYPGGRQQRGRGRARRRGGRSRCGCRGGGWPARQHPAGLGVRVGRRGDGGRALGRVLRRHRHPENVQRRPGERGVRRLGEAAARILRQREEEFGGAESDRCGRRGHRGSDQLDVHSDGEQGYRQRCAAGGAGSRRRGRRCARQLDERGERRGVGARRRAQPARRHGRHRGGIARFGGPCPRHAFRPARPASCSGGRPRRRRRPPRRGARRRERVLLVCGIVRGPGELAREQRGRANERGHRPDGGRRDRAPRARGRPFGRCREAGEGQRGRAQGAQGHGAGPSRARRRRQAAGAAERPAAGNRRGAQASERHRHRDRRQGRRGFAGGDRRRAGRGARLEPVAAVPVRRRAAATVVRARRPVAGDGHALGGGGGARLARAAGGRRGGPARCDARPSRAGALVVKLVARFGAGPPAHDGHRSCGTGRLGLARPAVHPARRQPRRGRQLHGRARDAEIRGHLPGGHLRRGRRPRSTRTWRCGSGASSSSPSSSWRSTERASGG